MCSVGAAKGRRAAIRMLPLSSAKNWFALPLSLFLRFSYILVALLVCFGVASSLHKKVNRYCGSVHQNDK